MNNLHRVFIAVNLPDKLKKEFFSLQDRWPELPARWTKLENLHVTLLFLGNANDQEVCDICKTVSQVAKRHEAFDLTMERISYGPLQKTPPRMVWVTGQAPQELADLQSDLERSLYEKNNSRSDDDEYQRQFTCHVTLARINQSDIRRMDSEEIPQIDEKIERTFMVDSIEVMESELRRGGPVYTVLESMKLGE